MLKQLALASVFTLGIGLMSAAQATVVYVGSWTVDQGPSWTSNPTAYSGQQAAAFLFGGNAADYVISTIDNVVANINHLSWVSTWDSTLLCGGVYPCGTQIAENAVMSTGGLYLNPGDTSAYVRDWAVGNQYTNYAFRVSAVPLPAALPLLLAGLGGLSVVRRRRKV